MKNYLLILILLFCASASAQYNYGNTRRYGGVDRSINGQMQQAKAQKKDNEKFDVVEESMKKLNEELTLDSFQSAVIRQLVEENQKKEDQIIAQDTPMEAKTEQIIALREKLNVKIKEFLSPEQIEKFEKMMKKKKR